MFLSEDLVREILLKLPSFKSVVRFSCVCKSWHNLIFRDPDFGNTFQKKDPFNPVMVFQRQTRYSRGFHIRTHNSLTFGRLEFPDQYHIETPVIGSCNGILCFEVSSNHVELYNPITREYRKLPPPPLNGESFLRVYGFGFDSSSDDYKVVCIDSTYDQVEIYSLRTSSWRKLDANLGFDHLKALICTRFLYVDGCCYWTVVSEKRFLTFDFRTETFGLIDLPEARGRCHISLGELDNCVAVCVPILGYGRTQVWVMSENSWIKKFTVDDSAFYHVWSWVYDTKLFQLKLDEKVITKEEEGEGIIKVFRVDGPLFQTITFKPNLVSLGTGYYMSAA